MDSKERQKLLKVAKAHGWSYDKIGAEIGAGKGTVSAIVKRESETGVFGPALDAWLIENANRLASEKTKQTKIPDPLSSVGLLMLSVGQDLQSEFLEPGEKINRLLDFHVQLNKRIKADIAAMEKWSEGGN